MRYTLVLLIGLLSLAGCGRDEGPGPAGETNGVAAPATSAARPRVVVLGDSLTAGLGISADAAYPAILQRKIDDERLNYEVINAGVSGDTTAGGLRRLGWVLSGDVRVLLVALGANDGLRGLPPTEIRQNLSTIISTARHRGIRVLLAGMEAPPNFGREYTVAFRQVYRDVAGKQGVPLIPFLLHGVAGDPALNQADGIHPTEEGARRVAEIVWPELRPLLVAR